MESFFDTIRAALAAGGKFKLSGFGNFSVREKKTRPGRNPKTGDPCEIRARRVVVFHAGLSLRERCSSQKRR